MQKIKENGTIKLSTLDNKPNKDLGNGSKLKVYEERNKQVTSYFISTEGGDKQGKQKATSEKTFTLIPIKRLLHNLL